MDIKNFLDTVKNEIKYEPIRENIEEELKSHIEDAKDDLMSKGLEENEAEEKAVEAEATAAAKTVEKPAAKKTAAAETTGTVAQNVISGGNADELQAKFLTPKKDEPDNNQPVGIKDELPVYLL